LISVSSFLSLSFPFSFSHVFKKCFSILALISLVYRFLVVHLSQSFSFIPFQFLTCIQKVFFYFGFDFTCLSFFSSSSLPIFLFHSLSVSHMYLKSVFLFWLWFHFDFLFHFIHFMLSHLNTHAFIQKVFFFYFGFDFRCPSFYDMKDWTNCQITWRTLSLKVYFRFIATQAMSFTIN
jgi:hypothetical protein